jgi:glycosyl-4,4'-diaponeurosporenoate acyltransferase
MADPSLAMVVVDSAAWLALSIGVGFAGHRLPDRWLDHDNALTRLRQFERDGHFWHDRFAVRQWKDRLPEAGNLFGGTSKKRLAGNQLSRIVLETRRAELVHWTLLVCGFAFAVWNPPALAAAMIAFGIVANAPFVVVQRFNRARLLRVLAARAA